jgi:glucose-1-phosphate adenylyltransferase
MFINALGLIMADHRNVQLGELIRPRALSAVPIGGRYRIIDFMLSNMVNSGINSVGVITFNKYKSLMDHLGTGSFWDLDRKTKGLTLLPPYINFASADNGDIDDMTGLLYYLRGERNKYVVVANSNVIFNATFNELVADHEESGADISLLYNLDGIRFGAPNIILETDRRHYVTDMLQNPEKTPTSRCFLGVMVLDRELLIDIVSELMSRGIRVSSIDSMLLRLHKQYRIRAFNYKGLVLRINSISTYFAASMRLLEEQTRQELFWSGRPVFTKVKDEAPSLYSADNTVSNSLISDGCSIYGSVTDSVVFRGVTLSNNAVVNRCVIFQDSYISEGVVLDNVILDKNCVVRPGVRLVGQTDYPVVIGKGAIV